MGNASSFDRRRQGVEEVMAHATTRGGIGEGPAVGSRVGGDARAEGGPGTSQAQSDKSINANSGKKSSSSSSLGIRRKPKVPAPSSSASRNPAVPRRDIKLFQGSGPIASWKKGNLVGKGATGAVFEAVDIATGEIFCVKEIEFSDDFADHPHDLQRFEALRREIELLKVIQHPNVVRFLGVDRVNFIIYIQMEYVYGGNIQDIVRNFGPLSEDTTVKFTQQILCGLDYLHNKNIIHRDIKGANILVGVDGVVKLADFGAAKRALDTEQLFKTLAGTPYWMAPEVVRQEGHNKAADVWSLGATVLQMLTGSAPYQSLPPVPALFKIGHSNESPVPESIRGVSAEALAFVRACLCREPLKRPSVRDLVNHPWITKQRVQRSLTLTSQTTGRVERETGATLDAVRGEGVGGDSDRASDSYPSPASATTLSNGAATGGAELALRNSAVMEDQLIDEETQIEEFVAYVSERHRALQLEQQAQFDAGLADDVTHLQRDDETDEDEEYYDEDEEEHEDDSRGGGEHSQQQEQQHLYAESAHPGENNAATPSSQHGDHASRCSSSGRVGSSRGASRPTHTRQRSTGSVGGSSTTSGRLRQGSSYTNNGTGGGAASGGQRTPSAETPVFRPQLSHRLEDDEDEADDDDVTFDDFDEAHFDRFIAGLSDPTVPSK